MQVGLIGLPQSGKKTLLRLLTGVDATTVSHGNGGAIPGICPVRDPRLDRLAAMYRPKKLTPATIEYHLLPDLTKDSAKNQELFKALERVDVFGVVVRAFADTAVFHLEGSVDPLRDIEIVVNELLLNDLLFVDKRLERIAKDALRSAGPDRAAEQALLRALHGHLNNNQPVRTFPLDAAAAKLLASAPLLSRKPLLLILNVGEEELASHRLAAAVSERYGAQGALSVEVSAKIEEELSQLEDPTERAAFLADLGLAESAIDRLTRMSYSALGLISYFTVGEDEVRAWTIRRGAAAPEAGGAIHSDIARGFIRAERIAYEDLISLGSEQAVSQAGKAQLKGKEYVVEDGDILNFRFNV
ncbi:MAG: redox-regulated ATPase YchF [Candidatus Omnitrophica bacterium]|nr:redox-regulated ATPase YchF [Candidatus Omnitrophota bacterium]